MSDDMMPKRWSVGNYDGYMVERDEGDYVETEDVEPLVAEITRLRARVEKLEKVREAALPHLFDPSMERGAVLFEALRDAREAKP